MSKKKMRPTGGLVYSTDPDFKIPDDAVEETETVDPSEQRLRVSLDTKHRAGKAVTLVKDFVGKKTDLDELGKKLKSLCGTGGSVKDMEIIVQGDNRDKIFNWLLKNGYKLTRKM